MSRSRKGKREKDLKLEKERDVQGNSTDAISLLLETLQDKFSGLQLDNKINQITCQEGSTDIKNEKDDIAPSEDSDSRRLTVEILPERLNSLQVESYQKLSNSEIQLWIEGHIKLRDFFCDVKSIGRNIYLGECSIEPKGNSLLINGLVKEKIQYSAINSFEDEMVEGEMKETVLAFPFKINTSFSAEIDKDEKFYISIDNYNILDTGNEVYRVAHKDEKEKHIFNKVKKKYILTIKFSILRDIQPKTK